ncbi:MAG: cytochrome P450 [Anaerolineae bacterium]
MSKTMVPPAPKGQALLGNMRAFTQDTLGFMLESLRFGDISSFKFGPFTAYMVNHPDLIHQVLVEDAAKYQKTQTLKLLLDPILGNGLFTSDGEFWRKQRKAIQPAFHTKRIGAYGDAMVRVANHTADYWQDGETLDIDQEMTHITMGIVSKTLFDADVSEQATDLSHAVTDVLSVINDKFNQLFPIPYWMPTAGNRRFKEANERLHTIIQQFIDDWRAQGVDKGDLLSMLMMARDDEGNPMSDKQIADEAMTLFGAGHETTANALTWVWYALATEPHVWETLADELNTVLGGRAPTLDDLPNLRYTEQVVKEAMRLYPPAWGITRETVEETQLGGYTIPKGSVAILNVYGVHRDPRFFAEPERFDPDRFTPEREKQLPKYAYTPFGGGPRICIGNAFAMMEAKLVLATLAQRWRVELAPGQIVEPQRVFVLRPKHGMKMIVHQRERLGASHAEMV